MSVNYWGSMMWSRVKHHLIFVSVWNSLGTGAISSTRRYSQIKVRISLGEHNRTKSNPS